MKSLLKKWYYDTDTGFRLLDPLVRLRTHLQGGWRSDRREMERTFLRTFGYPIDWQTPRTLNEKLNWMKRYYRNPLQQTVADKFAVRAWVVRQIGEDYLIPLLKTYARARDIRLNELPDAFVLKVNHGSGQNRIVHRKDTEDEREIRRQFAAWMRTNHYRASREWPYKGMRPLIVAETLLQKDQGHIPEDYKFHCFAGQVAVVQVDLDRETDHRRNFYDRDWHLQPFIWTEWEENRPLWPNGQTVPKPESLDEMIRVAETLSAVFPYVRVDLFECRGRVYFGELTFYHGGGFEQFSPEQYDRLLGDQLCLPTISV